MRPNQKDKQFIKKKKKEEERGYILNSDSSQQGLIYYREIFLDITIA